ncbi:MAG: hypothetical protein OEY63_05875 [Gemmatimonadota bacterium]|nr:hypothetical protein [Gemmatimonadota bacterium]
MKKVLLSLLLVGMVFVPAMTNEASAGESFVGKGSALTDTLQVGVITKLGNKQVTIKTEFEKKAKTYTLHLLPECYVMTAKRGDFKKFSELKKGNLIAAYGWFKDGKWNARRIDILDRNDYLVKRLDRDAKDGVYFKHEQY